MMTENVPLYLDYQATTPCDPRVVAAMMPFFTERFGNAGSVTHAYGREAAAAVERARAQVASLIGADPREIVWTSGAPLGGLSCSVLNATLGEMFRLLQGEPEATFVMSTR